jgi:hypothetical protein
MKCLSELVKFSHIATHSHCVVEIDCHLNYRTNNSILTNAFISSDSLAWKTQNGLCHHHHPVWEDMKYFIYALKTHEPGNYA